MEHKRKKQWILIIMLLLTVCSVFVVYAGREWMFTNPFKPYTFSSVSYASGDGDGCTYVIDDSNRKILKISADGRLLWRACASDKSFLSAERVVADGDGNVYLHDVRIEQGVQIASEGIVKLSSKGKYISTVASVEAEKGSVRRNIVGMVPTEHGVVYMQKEKEGILVSNTEQGSSKVFSVADAQDRILCCAYDRDSDSLFYVTYDGKIYKYTDSGQDELLYDSDTVDGSIPQEISYSDGVLYSADIGLRDIIRIPCDMENTGSTDRLTVEESLKEREIAYHVSAPGTLVSSTNYSVILWDGEDYEQFWDVPLSGKLQVWNCLLWAACAVIVAAVLFFAVTLLKILVKKFSFYAKITMAVIGIIVGVAALFIGTLFPQFQSLLVDETYTREKFAASAVTNRLPADAFQRLEKPSDFMNEDYRQVRQVVRDVFFSDSDSSQDLYCVLYKVKDGTVTLVYTLEDICVAYPYDWEYEGTDLQEVMEQGATKTYATNSSAGGFVFIHSPIRDKSGDIIGIIEVGTDMNSLTEKSREIQVSLIINLIAIMVVFFMLTFEVIYFIKGRQELKRRKQEEDNSRLPVEIFRFIVFLVFFFTNLTCAILPIYAMKISEKMSVQGLSPAMLAAVPISAEVLSGAIFSALGGKVIHKLGAKRSVFVSSVLLTAGLGLRVVPNIWLLTLSALLLGAGWGVLLLLVNLMIVELPDEEKNRAYAYYSVSSLSGANCAVVFGGFLLQWMSYTALFAVTAVLSVLLFLVANKYMSKYTSDNEEENCETEDTHMNIVQFIFRPRIISFFLLMMIPLLICGYFLNYMFPIVGSEWGLSETYIGYTYLLNGIFVLILGTPLTEFFSNRGWKHLGLAVAAFIYAAAFLEVTMLQNIPSLLIALALIGVADSFGIPLLTSYFTDLKDVERFGYDRGLGVYSLFENGAQSLGSFVFGYVLVLGVGRGLIFVLILVSVLSAAFLISTTFAAHRDKRRSKNMEKRRKLNVELIKFLIGSMLVVGVLMLLGSSLVNNRQYRKLYNDKALEIAKTVSDQVNGDFIEELCKEIDTEEFEQIQKEAVAADDEQPIIDWLKEKGMYQNYERINEYLHSIQADMNIEYLYIQMIQDHSSVYLFDPSSGYLTLGYKEELSERFDKLKGNERLEPTVSRTEFGWLSSAGEPVLSSDGEKCAVAFVDIDMTEIVRNTIRFTVLMVCLCILIILAAGMGISRKIKKRISRPIELITEATHKFGNGEEGYDENNIIDLDIHTRDEIEELYHATQSMQKSIINYMDNLTRVTAEKERIGAELNVATQIQASMLPCIFPAFPDRDEMDIYATMTPAKEVGGDFYDFFMVDDRHMAIVMADVSGKGVPAALFMVIGKTLIKDHTQPGRDLGEVFTEVNNILCESNENGMFITAFEGVLDLVTGEFRYVNAGHEMPFVYRRETNTYEAYKIRAGFVLAGIEDIVYKEQKLQLNIGDKIFQYTDGVTEATDKDRQLYGMDRLDHVLNQQCLSSNPEETLKLVKADIDAFVGDNDQFDDITMLCLEYTKKMENQRLLNNC